VYLLYYHYVEYDFCEHENIAVSNDKGKLEAIRDEMYAPTKQFLKDMEEYHKEIAKRKTQAQKEVRQWLENNVECVREIRPCYFDGEHYVPDFYESYDKPYSEEKKKREQERAIDLIVSSHWFSFVKKQKKELAELINFKALTGKFPAIEYEYPAQPSIEGKVYHDHFFIEEIKEL